MSENSNPTLPINGKQSIEVELVHEFLQKFKPELINPSPSTVGQHKAALFLNLIFEELRELASAFQAHEHFEQLCSNVELYANTDKKIGDKYYPIFSEPEEQREAILDALVDIVVVTHNATLGCGMQQVFLPAFVRVMENNMTKACNDLDEADRTIKKYAAEGIDVMVDNKGVVRRISDDKIMKAADYVPVSLRDFVSFEGIYYEYLVNKYLKFDTNQVIENRGDLPGIGGEEITVNIKGKWVTPPINNEEEE